MAANILSGGLIPDVELGFFEGGEVRSVSTLDFFRGRRAMVIGVPGAYTPVCTKRHVPDFVNGAGKLRAAGYDELVCIASNDPFVLARWAEEVDPEKNIRILSDGNLQLARALGVVKEHKDLFLGARSERYMLSVENTVIKRFLVEPDIYTYACTNAAGIGDV